MPSQVCPYSSPNVRCIRKHPEFSEIWLAEGIEQDEPHCTYETVVCRACTKLHFIHKETNENE
jgi:hypothetical protein